MPYRAFNRNELVTPKDRARVTNMQMPTDRVKATAFLAAYKELRYKHLALRQVGLSSNHFILWVVRDSKFAADFIKISDYIASTLKCPEPDCGYVGPREEFDVLAHGKQHYITQRCKDCRRKMFRNLHRQEHGKFSMLSGSIRAQDKKTDIDTEWLEAQWEKQEGLDYYTGEQMEIAAAEGTNERNWQVVSIDCKKPKLGYKKANCVLCTLATNVSKSSMTDEEYVEFCQLVLDVSGEQHV